METKGINYWDVTAVLLRTRLGNSGGKATFSTKQGHTTTPAFAFDPPRLSQRLLTTTSEPMTASGHNLYETS
jgi:hypothetical protein